MKAKRVKFEEGKTYGGWSHGRKFVVSKRTECYVWFGELKRRINHVRIDDELSECAVIFDGCKVYASCEW